MILMLILRPVALRAQETVAFYQTVEGEITADRPTQSWALNTGTNTILSVRVEAITESLDPALRILNNAGEELIANDDAAYPDVLNPLVEAITLPRAGQIQMVVSGFNGGVGAYTLTVTPGYADLAVREPFDGDNDWRPQGDALDASVTGGQLTLALEGINLEGTAVSTDLQQRTDFYAEARVASITSRGTWILGMTLRQRGENYYLVQVDSRGQWRFIVRSAGGETILRDWATHPAITPGQTLFTLAALVNGAGFDLFYNGLLLSRVNDGTVSGEGQVGLYAATENEANSQLAAQIDELTVTAPVEINGGRLFPQQLVAGDETLTVQELERRGVIPAGGQLAFNVGESFVDSAVAGVAQQGLGRGVPFRYFALATTATLVVNGGSGTAGCGLLLRTTGENEYMVAYVDNTGAYGVSQRSGNQFAPGIFRDAAGLDALQPNRLLIVVLSDVLHFYVNGIYAGALEIEAVDGTVGNALINFDPLNTTCQFADTWLWSWTE
ncbi:MAG: hypothetical protein SF029_18995 [bacterium]|nr:hypothetical protein [bacterium]